MSLVKVIRSLVVEIEAQVCLRYSVKVQQKFPGCATHGLVGVHMNIDEYGSIGFGPVPSSFSSSSSEIDIRKSIRWGFPVPSARISSIVQSFHETNQHLPFFASWSLK